MKRFQIGLVGLALTSMAACATLNTSGMTPPCRDAYNACLSGCPQPPANPDPNIVSPDFNTPSCVNQCNEQGRNCK